MSGASRRRRIQSGSFRVLGGVTKRTDISYENTSIHQVSVKRAYVPSLYSTDIEVRAEFQMKFFIYNGALMKSENKPLIVLHGLPCSSDYLKPLARSMMKNRTIILYDQIGCGLSNAPTDINAYSIDYAVQDLVTLIQHLKSRFHLGQFHILAHSFGGIIAFELLKERFLNNSQVPHPSCLSMTLSSVPFNVKQVDEDCRKVLRSIHYTEELGTNNNDAIGSFEKLFVCRTTIRPNELHNAFMKRGKVWTEANVKDYIAMIPERTYYTDQGMKNFILPRIFLMRGELDFVSESESIHSWKQLLENIYDQYISFVNLPGCSHYGMLENSSLYIRHLESFLLDADSS